MAAIPLRPGYGPTLGRLLAPRWRRASRARRALVLVLAGLLAAALALGVATVLPPTLSRGGPPASFSFAYPGLYRVSPVAGGVSPAAGGIASAAGRVSPTAGSVSAAAGALVTVRRPARGPLTDSFTVAPLTLAPYRGEPSAALALYANRYIAALAARDPGFDLRGEGWTQADSISRYAVYNVFYTTTAASAASATAAGGPAPRLLYGRDVLVLPERSGARRGLVVAMLERRGDDRQVTSPLLVGAKGVLEGPLTSLAIE
jgi:hypothetical protein